MLKKSAEIPQANKRYATEEVFGVFKVSASYPVRCFCWGVSLRKPNLPGEVGIWKSVLQKNRKENRLN